MTRRFTLLLGAAIAACGGDEVDLDSGPAADGAASDSGTTGLDDDSGDGLDGIRLDVGVTSVTVGDEGEETGGASGGSADDAGTDDGGSVGQPDGPTTACLPTRVFFAIDEHMHELVRTAELMAGVPSPNAPVGFLVAPGLPMPPSTSLQYAHPSQLPCAGPQLQAPECDGTHCIQVECTGDDASWMTLSWLETSVAHNGWQFDQTLVGVRWTEGMTDTEFAIATHAMAPDDTDLAMVSHGWMTASGGFVVVSRFFDLHPYDVVELVYVFDQGHADAEMRIGDVLVAVDDAEGQLRPTNVCPEPET